MAGNEYACFGAGLVGGTAIAISSVAAFSKWSLTSTDWATTVSGFGGAVLGAAVGGFISWILAKQASKEARITQKLKQVESTRASLLQLHLKTYALMNAFYTINQWIEVPAEVHSKGGNSIQLWRIIEPLATPGTISRIDTEDYIPLVHEKAAHLISQLGDRMGWYDNLAIAVDTYNRLRREFAEFAAPYSKLEGNSNNPSFPEDKKEIATIKANVMENLLNEIRVRSKENVTASIKCFQELRTASAHLIDLDVTFLDIDFGEKFTSDSSKS